MVDLGALASDIVANAVSLALPGALWAFLFLLAWEEGPFAESVGFGRRTFWLLLPGSALATFAILPFGAVANDLVAVSLGGAVFPLLVTGLALRRVAPPARRTVGRYLVALAFEGAILLALVLPVTAPLSAGVGGALGVGASGGELALVGLAATLVPLAFYLAFRSKGGPASPPSSGLSALVRSDRVLGLLLGLTSGVLVATFAASAAIPGVGIVEPFPLFLLPPIGAGAVAALVARRVLPGAEAVTLPLAYGATTWGVLLGADLLRQPPLYGSGPPGLYTIGGAGVLDLVYLSGLLALLVAYAGHRASGRPRVPVGGSEASAAPPTPVGRLGRAFRLGVGGHPTESLADSAGAAQDAAAQARRLLSIPGPAPERPWDGLTVPGWVVSDQANLDALAASGTTDGREGFRGWLTARALVRLGRELGARRFARPGQRAVAFLLDLILLLVPAVLLWTVIVLATPGDLSDALASLPFNAAIYGFIAMAFLYRALTETFAGRTVGKRALRLVVRDRRLEQVGFLSALARNVPVLPLFTVVGLGGALLVAFAVKFANFASVTVGGIDLSTGLIALVGVSAFVVAGVALLGGLGALAISLSSERQRVGDLWAGTWVVTETDPAGPRPPPGAARPPPAPGRGPSG